MIRSNDAEPRTYGPITNNEEKRRSEMPLTRDFKETIQERVSRDARFREALLKEAVDALLSGDVETGKTVLRNYINATVGFDKLATVTKKSSKSLMRMLGPKGNLKLATSLRSSRLSAEKRRCAFERMLADRPRPRSVLKHLFPVFPRLGKVVLDAGRRACRFTLSQEVNRAQPHRLRLLPRVHLSVDRAVDSLPDAASYHRVSVAPHQHHGRIAEGSGEGSAQVRGSDQQARIVPGDLANFEYRRAYAYEGADVTNSPKRNIGHPTGNDRGRMTVHHRHDLGARSENLAVDESFERGLLNLADRTAIPFELLDVRGRHRGRRPRLGHDKPVRILIVSGADMSEPVEHTLIRENAIGEHEVFDQCRIGGIVSIHITDFLYRYRCRCRAEVRMLTEKLSGRCGR